MQDQMILKGARSRGTIENGSTELKIHDKRGRELLTKWNKTKRHTCPPKTGSSTEKAFPNGEGEIVTFLRGGEPPQRKAGHQGRWESKSPKSGFKNQAKSMGGGLIKKENGLSEKEKDLRKEGQIRKL